jgi:hypothetical protein
MHKDNRKVKEYGRDDQELIKPWIHTESIVVVDERPKA